MHGSKIKGNESALFSKYKSAQTEKQKYLKINIPGLLDYKLEKGRI